MKKIIFYILFLFLSPAFALAEGSVKLQSAEEPVPVSSTPAPAPMEDMVVFSLTGSDITGWEESGEGKYIYLSLTDEKNEELARVTEDRLGKPLQINLNENFIIIPEITSVLNQKNGFVLMMPEGRHLEVMNQLDPDKRKKATTKLELEAEPVSLSEGE